MFENPIPFSLRQLQYALAIQETRNFRRAAERCAVAQPSLSAQLASLEEALGLRLFERGRGGVLPTPAGEALLPRFAELLQGAAELIPAASALRDPLGGALRLGLIPTIAPYLLPELAPALQAAFPRLEPQWTEAPTAQLVAQIRSGRLEAGFLALESELGDLECLRLGRDPFLLALPATHPLARRRGPVGLEELGGERLLLLEEGHCLRDQALSACSRAGLRELGFRATSLPTLLQMVAGGAGLTLLPRLAAPLETARARLALRPLKSPVPHRTLVLAWRRGSYAATALRRLAQVAQAALSSSLKRVVTSATEGRP